MGAKDQALEFIIGAKITAWLAKISWNKYFSL
jgi:hypothetical protein